MKFCRGQVICTIRLCHIFFLTKEQFKPAVICPTQTKNSVPWWRHPSLPSNQLHSCAPVLLAHTLLRHQPTYLDIACNHSVTTDVTSQPTQLRMRFFILYKASVWQWCMALDTDKERETEDSPHCRLGNHLPGMAACCQARLLDSTQFNEVHDRVRPKRQEAAVLDSTGAWHHLALLRITWHHLASLRVTWHHFVWPGTARNRSDPLWL